jgi:general secretion pathway protein D
MNGAPAQSNPVPNGAAVQTNPVTVAPATTSPGAQP